MAFCPHMERSKLKMRKSAQNNIKNKFDYVKEEIMY